MTAKGGRFEPVRTGNPTLDDIQERIAQSFDLIRDLLRGVLTGAVKVTAGDLQVGESLIVAYVGPGGHSITVPAANLRGTQRGQVLLVLNTGTGVSDLTLRAAGKNTIDNEQSKDVGTGLVVLVSDGDTKWTSVSLPADIEAHSLTLRNTAGVDESLLQVFTGATRIVQVRTGDGSAGASGYPIFLFKGLIEPSPFDASHKTVMLFGNDCALAFGTVGQVVVSVMSSGAGGGIQFGVDAGSKSSFHGAAPIAQAAAITSPAGGATIDAEARTAIDAIRTVLSGKGFTA